MVTRKQMADALRELGVVNGDIVIAHSSFKSLGPCENGADTVVSGMCDAVGEDGTVVFPTLCQQDWENVYKNWNLDAPSDVGYLTNYFRKLDGAYRSDQATHSVAAMGKDAVYLTETHGKSGLRYGTYGDTPFAADSPWQKMYDKNAKVLFIGCSVRACTFRHFAEYVVMDEYLEKAKKMPNYEELLSKVWTYDNYEAGGIWPHVENTYTVDLMEKEGLVRRATVGNAELVLVNSRDFVDWTMRLIKTHEDGVFRSSKRCPKDATIAWMKEIEDFEA